MDKIKTLLNRRKGFTLVELLVVIAIIGLLATLATVSLNSARQRARDSNRLSDVRNLQSAMELYYADNGRYPNLFEGILQTNGDTWLVLGEDGLASGNTSIFCNRDTVDASGSSTNNNGYDMFDASVCGTGDVEYVPTVSRDPLGNVTISDSATPQYPAVPDASILPNTGEVFEYAYKAAERTGPGSNQENFDIYFRTEARTNLGDPQIWYAHANGVIDATAVTADQDGS